MSNYVAPKQKITPFFWFDNNLEEAVAFYTSVFEDSKVHYVHHFPKEVADMENLKTALFELAGQQFMGMDAGPQFKFNHSVSFFVNCSTQEEVDYYWEKLSAGGEQEMCGWLRDKFGLSWQIVPTILEELGHDPDTAKAARAMHAMMKMKKIDIQALKDAAGE
jgi:predicted 3-demethylubiquinone-9 3-methyltransferase (glyoxalase superfamily)